METNNFPDITEHVDLAVKLCGGTQYALGERIGVRQTTISMWRTRGCRPSAENALTVQRATRGKVKAVQLRPDLAHLFTRG